MNKVVFLSVKGDYHTLVVGQSLRQLLDDKVKLSIIDMDDRQFNGGFTWDISSSYGPGPSLIKDDHNNWIDLNEAGLIWCRRFTRVQRNDVNAGFLTNQWNSASWFVAKTTKSNWIDPPRSIIDAENKPQQLLLAQEVGFKIPNTLVSQDPARILDFFEKQDGDVIVKPLKASISKQIFTIKLIHEAFNNEDNFSSFPSIYQQNIPGDKHLRIVYLPSKVFTFLLKSDELDWRNNRNIDIQLIDTDATLKNNCKDLLKKLNLTMGIIDAKVFNDEIYFLEVNPQGQFLFLEALSDINIRDSYAEYLKDMIN
jgi:glutathione synthase/RimK-type ligase-like ATP-grasp enzyme